MATATLTLPPSRPKTFYGSILDGPLSCKSSSNSSVETPFGGKLVWVGNATCIIEHECIRFMTDPNFLHQGDHVHLGPGITTTRVKDPAFDYVNCPAVDFILLSHLHEDHFDTLVASKLRRDIPIVSTPHACTNLTSQGFTALYSLDTWQKIVVMKGADRLTITAMPGKHTLGLIDKANDVLHAIPPVMSSLVTFEKVDGSAYNLYVSGDTLYYDELKEIHEKYPHIHLALIHFGATTLPVIRVMVTMDAEQGIKLLCALQPDQAIPIHMDDYNVFEFSIQEFKDRLEKSGWDDKVIFIERGEEFSF
ncbi:Metallo-hydrolase/oxidoreductase [Panus rudis PR-1116 ss-1]|nr:Metallo-hydrolase/oxidoreductase [Panus rudis PR-1116 ss-1]